MDLGSLVIRAGRKAYEVVDCAGVRSGSFDVSLCDHRISTLKKPTTEPPARGCLRERLGDETAKIAKRVRDLSRETPVRAKVGQEHSEMAFHELLTPRAPSD
jgi:hypothetical protein